VDIGQSGEELGGQSPVAEYASVLKVGSAEISKLSVPSHPVQYQPLYHEKCRYLEGSQIQDDPFAGA
jgi:hypothetical protein